jgi:hypothetical protein
MFRHPVDASAAACGCAVSPLASDGQLDDDPTA